MMPSVISGDANVSATEFGFLDGVTSGLQSQINAKLNLAGGKILQVVSATHATEVSTTSTTYVTTNLSASITPSSASNSVLVLASMPVEQVTQSSFSGAQIAIFRGSVSGTEITTGVGYVNGFRNQQVLSLIRMDSPATTSAQTYTIGLRTGSNQVTVLSCHGGSRANLILMEVSA